MFNHLGKHARQKSAGEGREDQTTAPLKIPGLAASRTPGGRMHFSSATPTGGILARKARGARTVPAVSAASRALSLRSRTQPRTHSRPGWGVHPHPSGKGPPAQSWRVLAFPPPDPEREATHPRGGETRAAFFSKTSNLHACKPARQKSCTLPRRSVSFSL